jgi:hypothetical protein
MSGLGVEPVQAPAFCEALGNDVGVPAFLGDRRDRRVRQPPQGRRRTLKTAVLVPPQPTTETAGQDP